MRAADPDGRKHTYQVDDSAATTVEEAVGLVQQRMALGAAAGVSLTVHGTDGARLGAVIDVVSRIQAKLPGLPIVYAGVPSDRDREDGIQRTLDQRCTLRDFGEADVILVSDARAPWASHAQVLTWMASRTVARLTVAATHEGNLVKLCQYLPMDLGLDR